MRSLFSSRRLGTGTPYSCFRVRVLGRTTTILPLLASLLLVSCAYRSDIDKFQARIGQLEKFQHDTQRTLVRDVKRMENFWV